MSRLPHMLPVSYQGKPAAPALPEIATYAGPAALGTAMRANYLVNNHAAHLFRNGMFAAGLTTRLANPEIWEESVQLQRAVAQRLQEQNENWLKGCAILMQDYVQIKQANTMSKLVEKQFNLITQWSQLLNNQATNLIGLLENIQVDYGYWASQKLRQSP